MTTPIPCRRVRRRDTPHPDHGLLFDIEPGFVSLELLRTFMAQYPGASETDTLQSLAASCHDEAVRYRKGAERVWPGRLLELHDVGSYRYEQFDEPTRLRVRQTKALAEAAVAWDEQAEAWEQLRAQLTGGNGR